ncbi:hypothetical protein TWF970_003971 [Orbilia oligospora]|uniref:RING-type E3 ubiquitin transferase n=1 Tax=Orbilia oligospora TaxID=2813651 RepID=A0A7C8RGQ1_ORBOL|nr:hypothetical protein TWF970_003971 [Orbilia oligospora]
MASLSDETCRICRSEGTPEEPLYHPCKCSGSIKYVHQDCLMEWLQHSQKKHCELCKTPFRFTKVYDPHMPKTLPFFVFLKLAFKHITRLIIQILRLSSVLFVWLFWLPWTVRTIWRFYFYVADGGPLFDGGASRVSPLNTSTINTTISGAPSFMGLIGPDISSSVIIQDTSAANISQTDRISDYLPPTTFRFGAGIANLTSSSQINQILVDTFEGQIITILVVLAFILIFLIREWVVQQQPPQPLDGNGQPVQQQDPRFDELLAEIERHRARREANLQGDAGEAGVPPRQHIFGSGDEAEGEDNSSEESVFGGNNSEFSFQAGRNEDDDGEMPFRFEEPVRVDETEFSSNSPMLVHEHGQNEQPLQGEADMGFDLRGLTELSYSDTDASTSAAPVYGKRQIHPMRKRKSLQIDNHTPQPVSESSGFSFQSSSSSYNPFQFGSTARHPFADAPNTSDTIRRPQISRELSAMAAGLRRSVEERELAELGLVSRDTKVMAELHSRLEQQGGEQETNAGDLEPASLRPFQDSSSQAETVEDDLIPVAKSSSETASKSYSFDLSSSGSDFNWNKYTEYAQQEESSGSRKGKAAATGGRESSSGSDGSRKRASDMSWEELVEINEEEAANEITGNESHEHNAFDDGSSDEYIDFHDQIQREILATAAKHYGDPEGRLGDRIRDVEPISVVEVAELVRDSHAAQAQNQGPMREFAIEAALPPPPPPPPAPINPGPPRLAVARPAPPAPAPPPVQAVNQPVPNGIADDDVEVDVDDFDGVMELIGMRGPLMALVQNGIFSAVLISATIGIGVWFPYMWGRVVLTILSNPLGFFITLPYQAIIFTIEILIDLAIMFGSFLVYFSDLSGRWLLRPAGWIFPYMKQVAYSQGTSDFTQNLATGAHSRISKSVGALVNHVASMRTSQSPQNPLQLFKWPTAQSLNKTVAGISKTASMFGLNGTDIFQKLHRLVDYPVPTVQNLTVVTDSAAPLNSSDFKDAVSGNTTLVQELTNAGHDAVWTPLDRIIIVIAGYFFISVMGAFYLQHKRNLAKKGIHPQGFDRKLVEGLGQAGSVMKVVLIIGIEMFVFPLYCGFLLDLALLPLFEHATIWNRWLFLKEFMFTSLFVHWFIGTCYMFHFALFVSMCRSIMRDGVLYFIRDPDDPTFHPVKEVLERPVTTQLKKIGFSAIIYGVLVIMFLGGVVWSLHYSFSGLLPVHWSSNEPVLEFPVDLLFYNIFMPLAIKYFRPANILEKIYGWWFRQCAKVLRLSSFMFGERRVEEEGIFVRKTWASWLLRRKGPIPTLLETEGETEEVSDFKEAPGSADLTVTFERTGRFVRAPAKDSVRPSRENLFIPVNEKNERIDGKEDPADGDFGPNSESVTLVYLPPNFRTRIGLVICLIWFFTACTGAAVTVGPLVFGRFILGMLLPGSLRMNDLYAFSLGLYALGGVVLIVSSFNAAKEATGRMKSAIASIQAFKQTAWICTIRALKIVYVLGAFVVVLPTLFAFVMEAYIILPLHTYFSTDNNHVIHFIQDWTLGVLYVKMLGRMILLDRDSAWSRSLEAIVANGYLNPDVGIATKKFVLPAGGAMVAALIAPLGIGFFINTFIVKGASPELSHQIYRYSYPAVLVASVASIGIYFLYTLFDRWKQSLRDEIYLVGERLHNHGERRPPESRSAPLADNPTAPAIPEAEPLLNAQVQPNVEDNANEPDQLREPLGFNGAQLDRPEHVLEQIDSSVQTATD